MDAYEFEQQIFLELLRTYHNGIGITHSAEPMSKLVLQLRREAKGIIKRWQQCESCVPIMEKANDR